MHGQQVRGYLQVDRPACRAPRVCVHQVVEAVVVDQSGGRPLVGEALQAWLRQPCRPVMGSGMLHLVSEHTATCDRLELRAQDDQPEVVQVEAVLVGPQRCRPFDDAGAETVCLDARIDS